MAGRRKHTEKQEEKTTEKLNENISRMFPRFRCCFPAGNA
jgi:hypothetical protein